MSSIDIIDRLLNEMSHCESVELTIRFNISNALIDYMVSADKTLPTISEDIGVEIQELEKCLYPLEETPQLNTLIHLQFHLNIRIFDMNIIKEPSNAPT